MSWRRIQLRLLTAISALLCAGLLQAQGQRQVEVEVTAIAGNSIYLDRGREAMIQTGDEVMLRPAEGGLLQAVIRSVSKTNSRAVLLRGRLSIGTGVRGYVLVPDARFDRAATEKPAQGYAQEQGKAPAHPPWSNPLSGQDPNLPLLAPAFSRPPEERPTEFYGRVFANVQSTWDNGKTDNRYLLARLGTDFTIENPLKYGGSINFRGEFNRREFSSRGRDEGTTQGRVDRLSYRWGDSERAPIRWEVGRFLQPMFPEFGLLDGVAADIPTGEFSHTGVSLGYMPEPFPSTSFEENFQTALFHRFANSEEEEVVLGIGYQKTWHHGAPDRDLILGTADLHLFENLYIHSSLWVDIYTSSDEIKSSGVQITQYHLSGSYRINDDHGIGMNFSHMRWPELLREEFISLAPHLISTNRVDRIGFNTWNQLAEHLRFDGRLNYFEDHDTDGVSGNVRFALRDVLFSQGEVSLDLFANEGSFTDGRGFRLGANRYFDGFYINLSYEWAEYDTQVLIGGSPDLVQQAFMASTNFRVASSTDISLNLDYRFGDSQNALTLGVYSTTRF